MAESGTDCESAIGSPPDLKEIQGGSLKGYMRGYLKPDSLPDSLKLLAAPPNKNSAAYALDVATAEDNLPLQGSSRWDLATRDADLDFPTASGIYSCALGIQITQEDTPKLYILLRRSLTDAGLATYRAKNHYQRPRPFTQNGKPVCTPEIETALREDGSYPSGHTSVGWAWALILSEIAPERQDQILARGISYGESRNVCNVHWTSDVQAGFVMGSATVAQLHSDPVFRADLRAAALEVKSLRSGDRLLNPNCAQEQEALKR
ncbi:phosphatase PAP2 family protein [Synechococcus sp. AH-601-N10]|nr:phosphatase PAP2 family protein [Synechococcus sp. AH-601-N10]